MSVAGACALSPCMLFIELSAITSSTASILVLSSLLSLVFGWVDKGPHQRARLFVAGCAPMAFIALLFFHPPFLTRIKKQEFASATFPWTTYLQFPFLSVPRAALRRHCWPYIGRGDGRLLFSDRLHGAGPRLLRLAPIFFMPVLRSHFFCRLALPFFFRLGPVPEKGHRLSNKRFCFLFWRPAREKNLAAERTDNKE